MSKRIQRFMRSHLKNLFIGFVLATSGFVFEAHAATYYISSTGSDSNSGTSSGSPWKTFGFAIPKLRVGDTLILRNGTYNGSNSGYPNINCAADASNGTSGNPITIRAENERQAHLQGSGPDVFIMNNCAWWRIEG